MTTISKVTAEKVSQTLGKTVKKRSSGCESIAFFIVKKIKMLYTTPSFMELL